MNVSRESPWFETKSRRPSSSGWIDNRWLILGQWSIAKNLITRPAEFLEALDRRMPALNSAREARVAADAAALKRRAELRIMQLEAKG
jgi:hypothetical protein